VNRCTGHDARCKVPGEALRILLILLWLPLCANAADYRLETVATGLNWPWSVAQLPDGAFLLTQRSGQVLLLGADGARQILSGTPPTLFSGEGGYLDIATDPAFTDNGLFYLSYVAGTAAANHLALYRARLDNGAVVDGQTILRVKPVKRGTRHHGGRMLFLPDGSLLLTVGDGFERREQAQSLTGELGKVLRIRGDGEAPVGNPMPQTGAERIYSYGHRNPQGLAHDVGGGLLYLHDHGPRGGDELNVLLRGENYGWPAVTEGVDRSGALITPFRTAPDMVDPIWTWSPAIAPSAMAFYNGDQFPEWRSSLLVSSLVDGGIRRLQVHAGQVTGEERLLEELGERIRDLRVFGDGIYLLTDGEQGRLLRLSAP
jgi:glucose/arabinose dehydrogenase